MPPTGRVGNTVIFDSQQSAQDWSDRLRTASSVAYFATVVATPGPPEAGPWILDKVQGLLVGLAAIGVTDLTTSALKSATGRTRPNGEGNQSFPSGHASHSAVVTGLAHDNLEFMELSPLTRTALDVGLDGLSVGTAWARVEAGKHFPSDVLFGLALGNFVSRFFDRALLGPAVDRNVALSFAPLPHGFELRWSWATEKGV